MLPDADAESHVHVIADGYRLVVAHDGIDRPALIAAASARWDGGAPIISRSAAGDRQAVLSAVGPERAGLDMETLARVEANARADDGWLSPAERIAVRAARSPAIEIACRWMLKEAYGKALGIGLALPLAALTFRGDKGAISLVGTAAPPGSEGWTFMLLRIGDTLFAVASRPSGDAVRPGGQEPPGTAA